MAFLKVLFSKTYYIIITKVMNDCVTVSHFVLISQQKLFVYRYYVVSLSSTENDSH